MTSAPLAPDVIARSLAFELEQLAKTLRKQWYWRSEADEIDDMVRELTTIAEDIVFAEQEAGNAYLSEPLQR